MAPRACAVAICGVVLLTAASAVAAPRVVIAVTRDSPALPALVAQVQLHAGRPIEIETLAADESAFAFAARASRVVEDKRAEIVVWVSTTEQVGTERLYLVYAAGRWPGRALIELVRIDARTPNAEVERTIALKISGLFETLTALAPIGIALGVPVTSTNAGWRFEVGAGAVIETGDRDTDARLAAGAAHLWHRGSWTFAAGLEAHWQPSSTIEAASGLVGIDELALGTRVSIERAVGRVTAFVRPGFHAALLRASGTNVDGRRGSTTVVSPGLGMLVGVEIPVTRNLGVVVAGALETSFVQQRFLFAGEVAADLRRLRGVTRVGVAVSW